MGVPIPGTSSCRRSSGRRRRSNACRRPGFLDWREIFGREAPVVFDVGCGQRGGFVISKRS